MDGKKTTSNRLGWSQQVYDLVYALYQKRSIKDWRIISQKFNERFKPINRSPKQIRERYTNHIKFEAKTSKTNEWTEEEDIVLFSKYQQIGAKWVQISSFLLGKSQNSVKNRFYASLRKLLRKINSIQKKYKIKVTYPIKYDSILKILEIVKIKQSTTYNFKQEQFTQLRNQILDLASNHQKQVNQSQIVQLINKFHFLSLLTRFININKGKKKNLLNINKLKYLTYNNNSNKDNGQQQNMNEKKECSKNSQNDQNIKVNEELIDVEQLMIKQFVKQNNQEQQIKKIQEILQNNYSPLDVDYLY